MRDLLSKLDQLLSEEPIKPTVKDPELQAKRKALQDLQMDPTAHKDPEIKKAIAVKKAELDKEARAKGMIESSSNSFQIGDEFGISFNPDFEIGSTIVGIVEDGIVIELDDRAFDLLTNEGWTFEDTQLDEAATGIDWREEDPNEVQIKIDGEPYYLRNTEKGIVILGEDIDGYWSSDEVEGALTFEADMQGNVLDSDVNFYRDGYSEADKYAIKEHVDFVIERIKREYGETWEEIEDEAKGGLSVEKEEITQEAEYQGRKVPLGKPMKGDVKKSKVYVKKPNGKVVKVNFGDKKMRIKKSNPTRRKSFRARHNCSNPGPRWKARYWSCRAW